MINKCNEENANKIIDKIFKENKDLIEVIKNEYSNYIVKIILEKYNNKIGFIYEKVKGNICMLSLNKYSSNIIEILLEYGNKEQRDEIGKEIINNNEDNLLTLANDKYGNYIIQKVIKYYSEDIKQNIINRLKIIPKENRKYIDKIIN